MIVKKLIMAEYRGFKNTEIDFQPDVNVIAGVNGAGKSSILNALRILISQALRQISKYRARPVEIEAKDCRIGASVTDLSFDFKIGSGFYSYYLHHNRDRFVPNKEGEVREQVTENLDLAGFSQIGPVLLAENAVPFALFFSPHRSLISDKLNRRQAVSGSRAVHNKALVERPTNLKLIAEWWLGQLALSEEDKSGTYVTRTAALQSALQTFLPEFQSVIPKSGETTTLEVVKHGVAFDIMQLSDGERSMLALVLEIARRLALAYPQMKDPIQDGEALILIDEIEQHLHPKWQREIVFRLRNTFPKCQFIMTTHSPFVISQVKAHNVILVEEDGSIRAPLSTYGLPAGEILESVQEVPNLHQDLIDALLHALDDFNIDRANDLLDQIRSEMETPNQFVAELETLIGNTRALLEDAIAEGVSE